MVSRSPIFNVAIFSAKINIFYEIAKNMVGNMNITTLSIFKYIERKKTPDVR